MGAMRIPVTSINKKFVNEHTMDDICNVVAWSFKQLITGRVPSKGFSGEDFKDLKRQKFAGAVVPKGVLAEVRADWVFLKTCFKFPQHNELEGICWQCHCKPAGVRDVGLSAPWRTERMSHFEVIHRMRRQGIVPSPLMSCPGIRSVLAGRLAPHSRSGHHM